MIQNLLPILNDRQLADARPPANCSRNSSLKIADLWRYESGVAFEQLARATGTAGNISPPPTRAAKACCSSRRTWAIGSSAARFSSQHGCKLLVLTQPEPDPRLTELRQISRARRGVETLVVGEDAFAFVEIIKRLQEGATVALLVDRPPAPTAVNVELFGRPFPASIAAAELARASGCAIVPTLHRAPARTVISRTCCRKSPMTARPSATATARIQLTQEILRAFEPAIRQHLTQWFHFVPIWPDETTKMKMLRNQIIVLRARNSSLPRCNDVRADETNSVLDSLVCRAKKSSHLVG